MITLKIDNLTVQAIGASTDRICYVLFPLDGPQGWMEALAQRLDVSIAVITGMDWDNDLTPWAAKGVPAGSPDFQGNAAQFLSTLTSRVIPAVEQTLHIAAGAERTLVGVSLSGLFTLWQWMLCDTFRNIISLSGSFWYEGFAQWITSHPVPKKQGKAYFLLGNQEAKTRVKAFQSVQTDTVEIVQYLHNNGIYCQFELVPGNHYEYGQQRFIRAMAWMYGA